MEVNVATGRMVLTKSARETLDVQTAELVPQAISEKILTYGTLASPWTRHALVSSPLSGRIVKLMADPGESVSVGQVLAELESPDLEKLQLELRTAQIELELSQRLVASTQAASSTGAIPGMRFVEAQSKMQQNQAALEIASAKWRGLRLPLPMLATILSEPRQVHQQTLALTSPIDGVITHADLSIGKIVDPKEHLFEVLDQSTVWLKIEVLEKDLSRVAIGQRIEFTLTALPGESFSGVIDVVDQFLEPETHVGTVWATLKNASRSQPRLLPGMSGQVSILKTDSGKSLVVPLAAVIRNGAERFVLVEEEHTQQASTYQKQTVVLGKRSGELIEIRGGKLFPGDRVVTRGSHELGNFFSQGVLQVSTETARDIGLVIEPAQVQPVADTLSIDGVVDIPPSNRTVAASQLSGSIERILVDRGQQVRRGQVLAEIVSLEFQNLQFDLLRDSLDASFKQKTVENLRTARLAISDRQLWEAESQLNQINSQRETIVQQLRNAGLSEEQLREFATKQELVKSLPVLSPIDGVLVGFDKFLGHIVRPDEALFEIHDLSHAWIQGFISERDLPRVKLGQSVRVRFVAAPEEIFSGILVRSGQAVAGDDRTVSVWIELKDMPKFPIRHNMLVRIAIETGMQTSQLAVPKEAIVLEGTRSYVFVQKKDNTFERRFVVAGLTNDLLVAIREGLLSGDLIATGGSAALQSGYAALK